MLEGLPEQATVALRGIHFRGGIAPHATSQALGAGGRGNDRIDAVDVAECLEHPHEAYGPVHWPSLQYILGAHSFAEAHAFAPLIRQLEGCARGIGQDDQAAGVGT